MARKASDATPEPLAAIPPEATAEPTAEPASPASAVDAPVAMAPEGQSSAKPAHAPRAKKPKAKLKLKIAHQVPGRIRLKMSGAKGDAEQLEQIKLAFGAIPGIEKIDVNPDSGSIVLKYDADRHDEFHSGFSSRYMDQQPAPIRPPAGEIDQLANKIQQEAEFLAEHSKTARALVDFCKRVDVEIKSASGNLIDFKMFLVVGLVGVTVLEIGAAAATPVWVTISLFGMNHFVEMQTANARRADASRKPD